MLGRLLSIMVILLVACGVSYASEYNLILLEANEHSDIDRLANFPGQYFGRTAGTVYLAGDPNAIEWLESRNMKYTAKDFPYETGYLYLCYFRRDRMPDFAESILDRGDNYVLSLKPLPEAVFCRRLAMRRPPQARVPSETDLILTYDPRIDSLIDRVSQDSLIYYLSRLSGQTDIYIDGRYDTIRTRYSGTEDNALAARYLKLLLESYGYSVEYHGFYGGGLRNVAAFNGQLAWAVAENNEALRTTDGGANWTVMPTGSSNSLWGISNVGSDSLWISGDGGTIRFSSDGGNSFTGQSSGTTNYLFGSSFVGSRKGWVVGDNGTIRRTTNGGTSWTAQTSGTTSRLYDVFFVDSLYGWAVGRNGVILATTNGGTNWTTQVSNTTQRLYGVYFHNRNLGWVVGWGGVVRRTTNGGNNWLTVNLGTAIEKYQVSFADSLHGCIVGWNGERFITTDAGTSWTQLAADIVRDLYGVAMKSDGTGFAVGAGIICKTTNFGQSWQDLTGAIQSAWKNIIATKTGALYPNQQVILCGHMDCTSGSPQTLAPGADDNGSGTIGVIEAARLMAGRQFEKTIKFCLWTGEEQGLLGSAAYAEEAAVRGDNIVGVFNFDMIAWDGNADGVCELHCGTSGPSIALGNLLSTVVTDYGLSLSPNLLTTQALGASDHASFWDNGYAAMLGIEQYYGDFNPYYHTVNDNMSHIVAPYFTNFTRAAVGATAALAIPTAGAGGDSLGVIRGHVINDQDGDIPGAIVALMGHSESDTSDANGLFLFSQLNPGTYALGLTHTDYLDTVVSGVSVSAGETTAVEVLLRYPCDYLLGDINGDRSVIGGDVTYGVRYFKGIGAQPPDSCYHDSLGDNRWLYAGGDVNGSCDFRGSDITRLVSFFKGMAALEACALMPVIGPLRIRR